jgi:putative spermidine/putrescine transport system substrate-binding protein
MVCHPDQEEEPMRTPRSRAIVSLAAISLILASCSAAATPAGAAAKAAKSAADMGGVDALCAAGKAEGQLNLIATPPDWANYGQMITDFTAKYGIKIQSDQPDVDSQAEINAATQLAGTGRQPDIFDLTSAIATAHTDTLAPYKAATWADIPDANKEATGLWTNDYTGFQTIGYDAKLGTITKVADLADPKYKGKVALNGDPLKAGAAFNGVVLAALANGGSADNIAPGVDFMKKLADMGNLLPVDPAPATIASGQTPIVIDWTYNNNAQTAALKPKGIDWKVVVPSDAPPVAAFYNEAINKDAPHPAAARCWVEYVFSDAGQNTWLKGFALPVRLAAMQKAGTIDQAAFAAINPPTTPPVQLTQAQLAAATKYLTDNWKFISIK